MLSADRLTRRPLPRSLPGWSFANLFYWCTNQYVIQRTLAARSLAEGQKGVLLSGFFKVLVPLLMMIPGVVAYHLYGPELQSIDLAYPQLVRDVMPGLCHRFFPRCVAGRRAEFLQLTDQQRLDAVLY
jgi:SSS family solute:Na+ symporter